MKPGIVIYTHNLLPNIEFLTSDFGEKRICEYAEKHLGDKWHFYSHSLEYVPNYSSLTIICTLNDKVRLLL